VLGCRAVALADLRDHRASMKIVHSAAKPNGTPPARRTCSWRSSRCPTRRRPPSQHRNVILAAKAGSGLDQQEGPHSRDAQRARGVAAVVAFRPDRSGPENVPR